MGWELLTCAIFTKLLLCITLLNVKVCIQLLIMIIMVSQRASQLIISAKKCEALQSNLPSGVGTRLSVSAFALTHSLMLSLYLMFPNKFLVSTFSHFSDGHSGWLDFARSIFKGISRALILSLPYNAFYNVTHTPVARWWYGATEIVGPKGPVTGE